ncbi:MAG: hypothetical protein OEY36_07535 [Gammaproteobacteria bacterium]|nr:hypothetical protein [Gammaproteobacteria bacterium]
MSITLSNNKTYRNPWLKLAMVFCLVSALWHVASHDLYTVYNTDNDCQVCRLNHASSADITTPVITEPVLLVITVNSPYIVLDPAQNPRFKSGARAPPVC